MGEKVEDILKGNMPRTKDRYNNVIHTCTSITSLGSLNGKDTRMHEVGVMPEMPDFTKRPKIMKPHSSNDYFSTEHHESIGSAFSPDDDTVQSNHYVYPHVRNTSVTFFSDGLNDEHTYNELPLDESLDDFEVEYSDEDMIGEEEEEEKGGECKCGDCLTPSRNETPDPHYQSLGNDINRSQSPFLQKPRAEYTTEIPYFYDPSKLKYPYKSPLDYSDEEFEQMNHFDFLNDLKFSTPPILPVYLNSNLLNDSSSKNYKTFPYQYQESNVPYVNTIYRYRINDLNLMDKYSAMKSTRPALKRASSSNSSNSSNMGTRSTKSNGMTNRIKLLRENSNGSKNGVKLKHADKIDLIEKNLVPHHVMLNHLITCNLNKDGYITSSCITRYKGKFLTQIMYFSNELEKL